MSRVSNIKARLFPRNVQAKLNAKLCRLSAVKNSRAISYISSTTLSAATYVAYNFSSIKSEAVKKIFSEEADAWQDYAHFSMDFISDNTLMFSGLGKWVAITGGIVFAFRLGIAMYEKYSTAGLINGLKGDIAQKKHETEPEKFIEISHALARFAAGNKGRKNAHDAVWSRVDPRVKKVLDKINSAESSVVKRPVPPQKTPEETTPETNSDIAKIIELLGSGNPADNILGLSHILSLGEIGPRETLMSTAEKLSRIVLFLSDAQSFSRVVKDLDFGFSAAIDALTEIEKDETNLMLKESGSITDALAKIREMRETIKSEKYEQLSPEALFTLIFLLEEIAHFSVHGSGKTINLEPDQVALLKGILTRMSGTGSKSNNQLKDLADSCLFMLEQAEKDAPQASAAPAAGGAASAKTKAAPAGGGGGKGAS